MRLATKAYGAFGLINTKPKPKIIALDVKFAWFIDWSFGWRFAGGWVHGMVYTKY